MNSRPLTLEDLDSRLSKVESKPKDGWDILQIVGAILGAAFIPVAILIVGNIYAKSAQEAEMAADQRAKSLEAAASERAAIREIEVATANSRVAQATVVASLLDALLSTEEKRVKLATEIVLVAMPDSGPALVKVVQMQGQSETTRIYAGRALDRRQETLIVGLFSDLPAARQDAYAGLMSGWSDDSMLVPKVISYARENSTNANGIYNSLVVLSHMKLEALRPHVSLIREFAAEAEKLGGSKIAQRVETLRSRLPT